VRILIYKYINTVMSEPDWSKITEWLRTDYVHSTNLTGLEGGKGFTNFLSTLDPNYEGGGGRVRLRPLCRVTGPG
jgi:hypothetical protein